MKLFKKYILLIFLVENLLAQSPLIGFPQLLFYLMLGVGLFLLVFGGFFSVQNYRQCKPLYLLGFVYVSYQFTIGISTISLNNITYLLAKLTTFVIIVESVTSDWDFYAKKAPIILTVITIIVLILGIGGANDLNSGQRMSLGFVNVNETGAQAAICIATVLFLNFSKYNFLRIIVALIALYSLLASGSRNSILMLLIIGLVWSNFSIKKILLLLSFTILLYTIVYSLDINLAGIDRLISTVGGETGTNREIEKAVANIMIKEKPFCGWGLGEQVQGYALLLYPEAMGAHNGYLETIIFMGYPFAIVWFLIYFAALIKLLKNIKTDSVYQKYFMSLLLSLTVASFYESYFVGVHELKTNMIFYSLAMLSTYQYRSRYTYKQI